MANVPRSYCPFRSPQTPGALSLCNDECALFIKNSKLPPQKSCAITLMGVESLQKIIIAQQRSEPTAPSQAPPHTSGGQGEEA